MLCDRFPFGTVYACLFYFNPHFALPRYNTTTVSVCVCFKLMPARSLLSWVRFPIGVWWVVRWCRSTINHMCEICLLLLFGSCLSIWLRRRCLKRRNDNEIQADEINEGILFIRRTQQPLIFVCRFTHSTRRSL